MTSIHRCLGGGFRSARVERDVVPRFDDGPSNGKKHNNTGRFRSCAESPNHGQLANSRRAWFSRRMEADPERRPSHKHSPPRSCTSFIPPMCASGSPATAACPGGLSSSGTASLPLWCRPATPDPPSAPTPRCAGRDYFPRARRRCGGRAPCALSRDLVRHGGRRLDRSCPVIPKIVIPM